MRPLFTTPELGGLIDRLEHERLDVAEELKHYLKLDQRWEHERRLAHEAEALIEQLHLIGGSDERFPDHEPIRAGLIEVDIALSAPDRTRWLHWAEKTKEHAHALLHEERALDPKARVRLEHVQKRVVQLERDTEKLIEMLNSRAVRRRILHEVLGWFRTNIRFTHGRLHVLLAIDMTEHVPRNHDEKIKPYLIRAMREGHERYLEQCKKLVEEALRTPALEPLRTAPRDYELKIEVKWMHGASGGLVTADQHGMTIAVDSLFFIEALYHWNETFTRIVAHEIGHGLTQDLSQLGRKGPWLTREAWQQVVSEVQSHLAESIHQPDRGRYKHPNDLWKLLNQHVESLEELNQAIDTPFGNTHPTAYDAARYIGLTILIYELRRAGHDADTAILKEPSRLEEALDNAEAKRVATETYRRVCNTSLERLVRWHIVACHAIGAAPVVRSVHAARRPT